MNSLKVFKVILFILAFIATTQIILLAKFEGLNESVESVVARPLRKSTQSYALAQIVEPKVIEETEETEIPPRIDCRLDDETQQMIVEKCEEYNLDFAFVMALIFKESSFRFNADSGTSVGLMQVNRINHKWLSEELGITDFFDPEQNVTAGLYMLQDLFEKYDYPSLVLMAYNMGENGAKKLWKQGIYSSAYSEGILQLADKYNAEIKERMD